MTITVRMGEIAISSSPGDELVARGLGSCIGLAVVDRMAGVAAMGHIVLPEAPEGVDAVGKFADRAVPELIEQVCAAGATRRRLEAVIAGGAHMFAAIGEFDIGSRNETAVRQELSRARIGIRAAETGGNAGRTLRVVVPDCTVTMNEAGSPVVTLLEGSDVPASRASSKPVQRVTR